MTEPISLDEDHLNPLHRHLLNLNCKDSSDLARRENNGMPAVYNFSAFVVEIDAEWFAITAGHIFQSLKKIEHTLSDWAIDDNSVASKELHAYPIPMEIDRDVLFINDPAKGYDYACVHISMLARAALEKNGIRPIPVEVWDASDSDDFPHWLLVGTPTVFTSLQITAPLVKRHATIHVREVKERPAGIDQSEFPRLYAEINFESVAEQGSWFDIGGMSGGPIFGLKSLTDAYDCYRLIGVQSGWNEDRHIALCPARPFIIALAKVIKAAQGCS